MKDFLYLDTSFLHSFIAQIYGGLPLSVTNESQESRSQTISDSRNSEKITELNALLHFIAGTGVKFTTRNSMNEGFSLTQFEAGKEIMSKQLHDNALDVLIDYLKENELLCITPSIEIEKFVLCKSTFKIVDLEYLENITKREFHDILGFDKKEVNKVKRVNFSINEFTKILKFTSEILPSRTFIKQENFILPLKKEYLREQPKEIIFKYNEKSEVNMLGRVTRKINIACETNPVSENVENFFSVTTIISEVINMFLESSGIIKNGDYVVSPVAIFFEST